MQDMPMMKKHGFYGAVAIEGTDARHELWIS